MQQSKQHYTRKNLTKSIVTARVSNIEIEPLQVTPKHKTQTRVGKSFSYVRKMFD